MYTHSHIIFPHTQTPLLHSITIGVLGGRQQTHVLLRVVCLMLMKARAEKLKTKLVFLTPNAYTVDEEVRR